MRGVKGIIAICSTIVMLVVLGCANSEDKLWKFASITVPIDSFRTIPQETMLDDLDLAGVSYEEAKNMINIWAEDKLVENLLLVYNDREIKLSLMELGVSLDFDKTWRDLEKNLGQRVVSTVKIDRLKLEEVIKDNFAEYEIKPMDASFRIIDDKFVIEPACIGEVISIDDICKDLESRALYNMPKQVLLKSKEILPEVTTEDMEALAFDTVIGEFTTSFDAKDVNRTTNLKAAASTLDKTLLKPGEIFSFNDTIGPRTEEAGYKDAYIILNNEYVEDIGGGICQVSSTLYSAAVLANLNVVERSPHAVAVSYIPVGQDATVYYPYLDLKFVNDTNSYVYIRCEVNDGLLSIRLYGKETGTTVRFEREIEKEVDFDTIYRTDSSLPPGNVVQDQQGSKGYIVSTWKIVRDKSGQEVKELLSRDEYAPANRILRIGAD